MRYLYPIAAVPNKLINDTTLHYTTKRVAVALLLLAGRKNKTVRCTIANLAKVSGCAPSTCQQAIRELTAGGYLYTCRNYRHHEQLDKRVYAASSYDWHPCSGGYTLIRREILDYQVSPAAFSILLFLYRCAGRKSRAFPSLRQIAGQLKNAAKQHLTMSKATVCAALAALKGLLAIICVHCTKRCNCYAANSYLLTDLVIPGCQASSPSGGSSIFSKQVYNNQITMSLLDRKGKNNSGKSGSGSWNPECFFTGKAWQVSTEDEQYWPF